MFRRRRRRASAPEADLRALDPEWRAPVHEALASRARFVELAERVGDGPLRDRLDRMLEDIDQSVLACHDIARRAQAAKRIVRGLDPERATAELKTARRQLDAARASGRGDIAALEAAVEDMAARHAAVHRAMNGVDEAADRLRLSNVRLGAAVAQALELVLRPAAGDELDRLDRELRGMVAELGALGQAFDELEP